MKTTLSTKSKRGDRGRSSGEENTQNKQPNVYNDWYNSMEY